MRFFSDVIGKLKNATRPLRQALLLARLPGQPPVHDIPAVIGLARGRLLGREHIRLTFSPAYAYKFQYLHRGLMQLAAAGAIRYSFLGFDPSLGRKTAVIHYDGPDIPTITGVIDGSAATWHLGQPDLDLDRVFGDRPRILFKMEYSEQYIHTRSSSQRGGQSPPIGKLYDRVVDGAYWPLNTRFLDARWVGRQHRRQDEPLYDLTTIYSLKPSDLVGPGTGEPAGYSERLQFLYALMEKGLEDVPGVRFRVGVKLARRTVPEQVPPDVMPYVIEQYLPYDKYLDVVFRSRLLYCPKNAWHEPGSDGAGERTYRLFENLALGCVCLSSPVRLHCDFEPGVHYVAIRGDFSDLEDVITHYLSRLDKLAQIRRNVQPLYERHLSPIAIARHYLATFRDLSLERTT